MSVAAGAMAVPLVWPAQAARAAIVAYVPCNPAALASAIGAAGAGATLNLAAGCKYVLTAALPTVSQDLTIDGDQATLARSTAPGTPQFTILTVDAGTLTVSDLNFTNGNDALFATNTASLSVTGGTFKGNSAVDGGAINAYTGPGTLSVTGATFAGNSASDAGGAIYTNEAVSNTTLSGDKFRGNSAVNAGGAVYDFNVTGADISGSVFNQNQSAYGGALFDNSISGESLNGVTVRGNSASADGGGFYTVDALPSIANSTFGGNSASEFGGGLYQADAFYAPYGITLTNTTVHANSAQSGGGVYSSNDGLILTGSTVKGNTATADGAGIYNDGSQNGYDTVTLATTTVSGNQAGGNGGGVYNIGELDTSGSQINRNTAGGGGGGVYDGPGGFDTVSLANSQVLYNLPDNCEPTGTVTGCDPSAPAASRMPGPAAHGLPGGHWACHPASGGQVCCAERAAQGARPGSRVCLPHRHAPMVAGPDRGPLPLKR
jgi:predicted outer membrane repeat protein